MLHKNSITIPAVTIQLLKRNLHNYKKNYLLNIVLPSIHLFTKHDFGSKMVYIIFILYNHFMSSLIRCKNS